MSNDNRRGPGRGPMGHGRGMMPGEKAKDFKGTMKKLMSYLGKYTYAIIAVFIFAIGSVAFSVIGPKVLGKATTEIFNGLIGKISGGDGIDFDKIKIIHFSDNNGKEDLHIGYTKGILDSSIFEKIENVNPDYLILEINFDDIENTLKYF